MKTFEEFEIPLPSGKVTDFYINENKLYVLKAEGKLEVYILE
jgi:hypothetical protein